MFLDTGYLDSFYTNTLLRYSDLFKEHGLADSFQLRYYFGSFLQLLSFVINFQNYQQL